MRHRTPSPACIRRSTFRRFPSLLLLSFLCLLALAHGAQDPPRPGPPQPGRAGEWLAFEGDLSASGTRQILAMARGRVAQILHLSGSLFLTHQEGLDRGFRCEVVAYDDGAGVSAGSCVWTDERGDRIFSDIRGESVEKGKRILGAITGGTGRYAGISGEYEFVWQFVVQGEDGAFQGRAVGLKGRARLEPPSAPRPPGGAKP